MARRTKIKAKEKATLTPKPNWDKLRKAKTEEAKIAAWRECDQFVQYEITSREYVHNTRKWIREHWDKDTYKDVPLIPDVYLANYVGKDGYKAFVLQFMPERVSESMKERVDGLLAKLDQLRAAMAYESPIHPSIQNLDEDHNFHPTKVKQWMDIWKKRAAAFPKDDMSLEKLTAQTYAYNCAQYLKNGVWLDSHWGENRENKTIYTCVAPAFDRETGEMKMTKNTYYPSANVIHGVTDVD